MKEYTRGETPNLYAVIHEETLGDDGTLTDGDLATPAGSYSIIIWDCVHDVVQASVTMTADSTGKLSYSGWTIPLTALCSDRDPYEYEVHAVDGSSKKTIKKGKFMVKEHIA